MGLISLVMVGSLAMAAGAAVNNASNYEHVALCSALERIAPGEVLPVILTGVYEVDSEAQVLFDPEQPVCTLSVQPATWVEFAPGVATNRELAALLQGTRRATVTFQGQLFGPGRLLPDDPSLPFAAAFSNRVSNRRYGHMNFFRTKFVVEAILQVGPVPPDVLWEWGGKPVAPLAMASPQHLDVPEYPAVARERGVEGEVVVEVGVAAGRVTAANVRTGDRLLAGEAIANIHTWHFKPGTSTTFTTTFVYQLERRKTGDESPRIELHLPDSVRITAASYDW